MSNRRKDQSEQRTVDWNKIVHPSLRVSNQEAVKQSREPLVLSGGCLLYYLDIYRQSVMPV
jgi:hypothetical protein